MPELVRVEHVADGMDTPGGDLELEHRGEPSVGADDAPVELGQFDLARFVNPAGLRAIGDNLFLETPASGQEQVAVPGQEGYGSLLQTYL